MKLLSTKYKTFEGARKRAGFENGVASSEFRNGYKAKLYRYTVEQENDSCWRVARHVAEKPAGPRADMLCKCGSVLSAVTFSCVRGDHCPARS